jgi:hypothetical protein
MEEIGVFPQKIVDIKTIILKPRLDSDVIRGQGEKIKTILFGRFGFLKPRNEDVTLINLNKYYEPFVVVGGKYSIDYCKRHNYAIEVEGSAQEIFIDGKKLSSEPLAQGKPARVIRLTGEEHSHYQTETYLVLDRNLQEVSPKELLLAPFEYELEKQQDSVFDLRKVNICLEEEITFLRSRIVKRPPDVAEVIKEVFEISDRTIVYRPIYELIFHNVRNGKNATVIVDGITGEVVLRKLDRISNKLMKGSLEPSGKDHKTGKAQLFQREQERFQTRNDAYISNTSILEPGQSSIMQKLDISPVTAKSDSFLQLSPENATFLAVDLLKGLGYKRDLHPTKVSRVGEDYVVEIGLEKRIAKVRIDVKAKEIREYELQDVEA